MSSSTIDPAIRLQGLRYGDLVATKGLLSKLKPNQLMDFFFFFGRFSSKIPFFKPYYFVKIKAMVTVHLSS